MAAGLFARDFDHLLGRNLDDGSIHQKPLGTQHISYDSTNRDYAAARAELGVDATDPGRWPHWYSVCRPCHRGLRQFRRRRQLCHWYYRFRYLGHRQFRRHHERCGTDR